jgi:MFS family permease
MPKSDAAIAHRASAEPSDDTVAPRASMHPSAGYSSYVLGVLFLVYVFNFIDRSVINILAPAIIKELNLSDWDIGLMNGVGFAIIYCTLGIPIARLADRRSRRNIIAICLTVWSVMTAVCGFVQNFTQLLLARIGVAVGEAGGSPPAHSIISDLFAADRRATALAVYALGIPVGNMIGNLAGGWLNETFDWRTAFIVVGTPGVLMALILRFTVTEPPRGFSEQAARAREDAPPVGFVFKALWSRKSFRYMTVGGGFHALVGYGVGPFIPTMFSRVHGLGTTEIGRALFLLGFAGILGTLSGGYVADSLAKRDARWYVWLPGIATLLSVPFSVAFYLLPEPTIAFWVAAVPSFLGAYYLGPTFSLAQGLVGLRMRALTASILLFILNLIGMVLGPLYVGGTSDFLHNVMGFDRGDGLRWALVSVLIFNVLSTVFYLLAAKDLRGDLARSHELA